MEADRREDGLLHCTHADCVNEIRAFSRRCEYTYVQPKSQDEHTIKFKTSSRSMEFKLYRYWQEYGRKHMDKHTRPYVCEEVGCERAQGFTYSGGLHRHQREVHHKHGDPKTSYLCPHRHCQRSIVGRGFTRKENLAEHLRRIHRADVDEPAISSHALGDTIVGGRFPTISSSPNAQVSSKRRKSALDVGGPDSIDRRDGGDDESKEDLKLEVKRLLREVELKDDKVKYLESVIDKLERRPRGPWPWWVVKVIRCGGF